AIGFIALFGIAVMEGIILLSYFNQLVEAGARRGAAIMQACQTRFRPVMMTCIAACVGLLPAALSTAIGAQVQRPLALVGVGGILLTPVLVLIILPVLIDVFSRRARPTSSTKELRNPRSKRSLDLCEHSESVRVQNFGLEPGMEASGERIHRTAVPVVGGVRDELVVEADAHLGCKRVAVISLEDFLEPGIGQLSVADEDAQAASIEKRLVHAADAVDDTGDSNGIVRPAPVLAVDRDAARDRSVDVGKVPR